MYAFLSGFLNEIILGPLYVTDLFDCNASMHACMQTSVRICECVLCQQCAKNLLPQRFSLHSHTLTHTHNTGASRTPGTLPQRLAVLLQVLPVHQPINRQHIYFLRHVLAVAFSSIFHGSEQVHFYKRKSPLWQRCCGTQATPSPSPMGEK